MTGHRIFARHSGVADDDRLSIPLIKRSIRTALRLESVDMPCEVSVLITDENGIRELNREFRGVDIATDVLSFPALEFTTPGWSGCCGHAPDPETGAIPLGDIILSAGRVKEQSREYSQSRERETAYLTVHSVLHLLGYDHMDEAEQKRLMRAREKEILKELRTV